MRFTRCWLLVVCGFALTACSTPGDTYEEQLSPREGAFEDGRYVREALAAGVAGYVPKSAAAVELIAAIKAVVAGGRYVHPRVVGALIETSVSRSARADTDAELSGRENEVLRLIGLGFTNKEISSKFALSLKTIETYKARAMEKIGASSRVHVVRFAVAKGWLADDGS